MDRFLVPKDTSNTLILRGSSSSGTNDKKPVQQRIDNLRKVVSLDKVLALKFALVNATSSAGILAQLEALGQLALGLEILEDSSIGKVVQRFKSHEDAAVKSAATELFNRWKSEAEVQIMRRQRRKEAGLLGDRIVRPENIVVLKPGGSKASLKASSVAADADDVQESDADVAGAGASSSPRAGTTGCAGDGAGGSGARAAPVQMDLKEFARAQRRAAALEAAASHVQKSGVFFKDERLSQEIKEIEDDILGYSSTTGSGASGQGKIANGLGAGAVSASGATAGVLGTASGLKRPRPPQDDGHGRSGADAYTRPVVAGMADKRPRPDAGVTEARQASAVPSASSLLRSLPVTGSGSGSAQPGWSSSSSAAAAAGGSTASSRPGVASGGGSWASARPPLQHLAERGVGPGTGLGIIQQPKPVPRYTLMPPPPPPPPPRPNTQGSQPGRGSGAVGSSNRGFGVSAAPVTGMRGLPRPVLRQDLQQQPPYR